MHNDRRTSRRTIFLIHHLLAGSIDLPWMLATERVINNLIVPSGTISGLNFGTRSFRLDKKIFKRAPMT